MPDQEVGERKELRTAGTFATARFEDREALRVRQTPLSIIVRQPPAKITVELEQPEIIVRMPGPEIDAAIAERCVEVSVLERGQPRVHYERMGDPQLTVRQRNGAPRIRFEQMSREEALDHLADGAGPRANGALACVHASAAHVLGVRAQTPHGDDVGEVERVLIHDDGAVHLVLVRSGFLGLSPRRVRLPLATFALCGDRLLALTMTDADIDGLERWDERMAVFTDAAPGHPLVLPILP